MNYNGDHTRDFGCLTVTGDNGVPYWQQTVYPYYYAVTQPPRECSGDVHVFPCPHCEKCKCGQATVKRGKK